jgi:uncharacterized damage-inducible protein DinB
MFALLAEVKLCCGGNREVAFMDSQKELISEFDREMAKTRKTLDAIPDNADYNYKPHPKSMSLGRLAGHLTDFAGDWGLHTLTKDKVEFGGDQKFEPYVPKSKAALLERFDNALKETREALLKTNGDTWDRNWKFVYGGTAYIDRPKHQVFREAVLDHMIHHRGQMSVYLRLLDAKVPGAYGPSADEM